MDINYRAYCNTHNFGKMWNFNLEMTRNSRKGSLRSPKNVNQFPEVFSFLGGNLGTCYIFRKPGHIFRKPGHIFEKRVTFWETSSDPPFS